MNSHCFPFRQVPHTSQLFLDYLEHNSSIQRFFPRSARFHEWAQDESSRVDYPANRREQVAQILERQNPSYGASSRTLGNISAFRSGAFALATLYAVGSMALGLAATWCSAALAEAI